MAESDGGYALIYRRMLDHPAFRTHAEAMAFAYLVIRAAWRPCRVRYKDRAIVLERGQLALSVRDFAAAMERSKSWADRFLKRCANRDMIGTDDGTGVNVITICNYSQYQVAQDTGGTPMFQQAGQDRDTEQRRERKKEGSNVRDLRKNDKEEELDFSFDWLPSETWAAFKSMRRSIKKPMTAFAEKKMVAKLERMQRQGWDVGKLLERSIINCWQDVYEPRPQDEGQFKVRRDGAYQKFGG